MDKQELTEVSIVSAPDEKGHYHVAIEAGPDTSFPMDATSAYAWAREVLSAVAAAEYDAAVLRQMRALTVDDEAIAMLIMQMRSDRAEAVPLSMVPGLSLKPGVSQANGKGFLELSIHGERVGQWHMDDARQHALALIESLEVSVLDGAYLRALEGLGLEREQALVAVTELGDFRE